VTGIFDEGVREDIDLRIQILESPYVTHTICVEYVRAVLIPAVDSDRSVAGCQNKPAILFCDNEASHGSDEVNLELAEHGILLLTSQPHTSHIFQVLERLLFGCLKSAKKRLLRDLSLGRDLDHESHSQKLMGKDWL
jgi:transposase InsO family protein